MCSLFRLSVRLGGATFEGKIPTPLPRLDGRWNAMTVITTVTSVCRPWWARLPDENPRGRSGILPGLRCRNEGCTACPSVGRSKMNGVAPSLLCPLLSCLMAVRSVGRSVRGGGSCDLVDPSRVYLPGGQEIRQILGNRASGAHGSLARSL